MKALQRKIHPSSDVIDLAQDVAKKEQVTFVSTTKWTNLYGKKWPTECYFDLGKRRTDEQVAKKTDKIVDRLRRLGIGDERGVYAGTDWYCADVLLEGVPYDNLVKLACGEMEGKSLKNIINVFYFDEDDSRVELIHRNSRYDPITIERQAEDVILAKFRTEEHSYIGLQIRYLFGVVSNQLFDSVPQTIATIRHYRLPFWGE